MYRWTLHFFKDMREKKNGWFDEIKPKQLGKKKTEGGVT